jgi:hypothetical protein
VNRISTTGHRVYEALAPSPVYPGLPGAQEEMVAQADVDLVHATALASRLSVLMIAGFS